MWLKVLFAELLQNSNIGRSTQNCYIFRLLPWVSSWSHRYVILTGRSFFCLTLLLDFIVNKGSEKTLGIFACWSSCWPLFSYYWSKFKTDKFKNPGYRHRCVSNWRRKKREKIKFPKGMTKTWQPDVGVLNLSKKSTSQTKYTRLRDVLSIYHFLIRRPYSKNIEQCWRNANFNVEIRCFIVLNVAECCWRDLRDGLFNSVQQDSFNVRLLIINCWILCQWV